MSLPTKHMWVLLIPPLRIPLTSIVVKVLHPEQAQLSHYCWNDSASGVRTQNSLNALNNGILILAAEN